MRIAVVQIGPVYLNSEATWSKLEDFIRRAAAGGAELVTWGESLLPGYPNWTSVTTGDDQKATYAAYCREALELDGKIVKAMCALAKELGVLLIGGIAERSGGSVYATVLTISATGELLGRHRKIKPTWRERLVWADGDALGLNTYDIPIGKVGSLNCWENWVPYARAALHRQGEFLHIGVWPGSDALTKDITRFVALEGRSWSVAASGLLRSSDFADTPLHDFPQRDQMMKIKPIWQNGGSRIVSPEGELVAGPLLDEEGILYADIDAATVLRERQNFDISGHYSRPDIFSNTGDRVETRR